jgi:hypothetical protein
MYYITLDGKKLSGFTPDTKKQQLVFDGKSIEFDSHLKAENYILFMAQHINSKEHKQFQQLEVRKG